MYNSLISPEDYQNISEEHKTPQRDVPPLTREETNIEKKRLLSKKIPQVDRKYIDPPIQGQNFCLFSFVPSKNARPDSHKIFGMIKCRGVFDTIENAEDHAENLMRNVDNLHVIHIAKVGSPFPFISDDTNFAEETVKVDLQQRIDKEMRREMKKKKQEELKEKREIMERQQKLLSEQKEDAPPDPFDEYTTLQVKRAQLIWTWKEIEAKREDVEKALLKTRNEIREMDDESKEYSETYMEKYNLAREMAGIPEDTGEGFVSFMMRDVKLPFETE
jgi:hypothetical protein